MRYKKIIAGVVILILFICSVFMIYNINSVFPNSDDKVFRTGDVTRYRGLKLTFGEIGVYTKDEMIEKYPAAANNYFPVSDDTDDNNYVIAIITLENDTEETISFGKFGSVTGWAAEAGLNSNGSDYNKFIVLNTTYSSTFLSGAKQEIILPFAFPKYWITYDELKKEDIKIIYSFYPSKCFVLYEGKKQ